MNKAILMSIRPEWLAKILNGEKTIEIRKSMPKCGSPIDVYLYCQNGVFYFNSSENEWQTSEINKDLINPNIFHRNNKVVAKFTLNHISTCLNTDYGNEEILKNACLTKQELDDYIGKRKFFAWHIKRLEIFNKPKDLWDFHTRHDMLFLGGAMARKVFQFESVYKAPQSWRYVYVKEKENG